MIVLSSEATTNIRVSCRQCKLFLHQKHTQPLPWPPMPPPAVARPGIDTIPCALPNPHPHPEDLPTAPSILIVQVGGQRHYLFFSLSISWNLLGFAFFSFFFPFLFECHGISETFYNNKVKVSGFFSGYCIVMSCWYRYSIPEIINEEKHV